MTTKDTALYNHVKAEYQMEKKPVNGILDWKELQGGNEEPVKEYLIENFRKFTGFYCRISMTDQLIT